VHPDNLDYGPALSYLVLLLSWIIFIWSYWKQEKELAVLRGKWLEVPGSEVEITEENDMAKYTYADLADKPFVPPTAIEPTEEIEKGRRIVNDLAARNPELAAKLRAAAIRTVAAKRGPITSTDVWVYLRDNDPTTMEAAKKVANGRIMTSAFDGPAWEKTGRYLPQGSHGRPVSEWRYRHALEAA